MRCTIRIVLSLFLLWPLGILAAWIEGSAVRVADGDTLTLCTADSVHHKIRLYGIDAPETKQPFGPKAKAGLIELTLDRQLRVDVTDTDRYGRLVGKIYCDSIYVNRVLVDSGLAWHYIQYARKDSGLATAQRQAQTRGVGLWSQTMPQAPWEFRKMKRRATKNI